MSNSSGGIQGQSLGQSSGVNARLVKNDAAVKVGNDASVRTNEVENPVRSSGGGGRGGSGGGGSGSGSGGPGSGGGSEGEGDSWDLLPIPQTGQGRAMLFGGVALVVSAMALVVLLWYKRRETKD